MDDYVFLRVLHIAIAASWLGVSLGAGGQVKRALAAGPKLFSQATRELRRRRWLSVIMGSLTVVTGVVLILSYPQGFKGIRKTIHAALGLGLIKVALGVVILKVPIKRLVTLGERASDQSETPAPASDAVRRLAMWSGIDDLLWLVLLTLMYWR